MGKGRAFGLLIASMVATLLSERLSAARTKSYPIEIANQTSGAVSRLAGRCVRVENPGAIQSAEITVVPVIGRARAYAVSGQALWGIGSAGGPHDGDFHFVAKLVGNILKHSGRGDLGRNYEISIHRTGTGLIVTEQNSAGVYGMNVVFEGRYRWVGIQ